MRVVHVTAFALRGGASRAVYRLHQGLLQTGVDSMLFTSTPELTDPAIRTLRPSQSPWDRARRRWRRGRIQSEIDIYEQTRTPGSVIMHARTPLAGEVVDQLPGADLLHLHWIHSFVDFPTFFSKLPDVPVVWTLHDMMSFTGGCDFSMGCRAFQRSCGNCPQLGSDDDEDLTRRVWRIRRAAYAHVRERLILTPCCEYLAREARESSLLGSAPSEPIHNGVNTDVYAPLDPAKARALLKLPQRAKIILGLASSLDQPRKGYRFLTEAAERVHRQMPEVMLVLVGRPPKQTPKLPFRALGWIGSDSRLAAAYAAADVFAMPSVADACPLTVLEAMSCGTPTVAFPTGGLPELVRPGVTGLLTERKTSQALSDALLALLWQPHKRRAMSVRCRQAAVAEFDYRLVARKYLQLYRRILPEQHAQAA